MASSAVAQPVTFQQGNLLINGQPTIILASSLFYFRIPRGLWQERLHAVRAAGYTCIDVYTPWNYHEPTQGGWDFSGEHDVAAFFQMAAEAGLWVIARPGPYICSEWDGGALPAYLLTDRALRLRDNDARYLGHVARWFDQILPIIRRFQVGAAGTIIAVQLENELDFYECQDPQGYMTALRDLALAHDIAVPLIACAGQGNIPLATGTVAGLIPTCNFYPNDRDPAVEERVATYYTQLRDQELPLLITETNRAHFFLRRLLSTGAKLLGPYLQASGFNFGFTASTNNWGQPLAFMTSDYDFAGMIGPYGELRAEVGEGRLLSHLIAALGPALAQATPTPAPAVTVTTALPLVEGGPRALALAGGGLLLALPNLTATPEQVTLQLRGRQLPVYSRFTIAPDRCPFVLFDFLLTAWAAQAAIAYATAEVVGWRVNGAYAVLAFSDGGEVELILPGVARVETTGMTAHHAGDRVTLVFDPQRQAETTIYLTDGKRLRVVAFSREVATTLRELSATGEPLFFTPQPAAQETGQAIQEWSAVELSDAGQALGGAPAALGATAVQLEEAGIGRGFGWYKAQVDLPAPASVTDLLVHNASDVLSLYWGDRYQGTVTPGGATVRMPVHNPPARENSALTVRAEIWGHSNFDDPQLPGLRLSALKGLTGITAITNRRPLTSNWRWQPNEEPGPVTMVDAAAPVVAWGSWQTTKMPDRGAYVKTITLSLTADTWVLQFTGLQALVRVWINAQPCGVVSPRNPFVDLTPHGQPGERATITLDLERWHMEAAGQVTLLEGRRATDWSLGGADEERLWSAATQTVDQGHVATLPYRLTPGGIAWLFARVDQLAATGASWTLHPTGRNAKVTAFFNGYGVGRLWLPSAGQPSMRGGHNDALYLPAPWFQPQTNLVALLIEAIDQAEAAEISEVLAQRRP